MNRTLIKEIVAPSNNYKANIYKENEEVLRIIIYKLTHEIVEGYGEVCEPFWEEYGSNQTLIDSIDNATEEAVKEMFFCTGEIADEQVILKWIKRVSKSPDVSFVSPGDYEIRYTEILEKDSFEVIEALKLLQFGDYYLAQDNKYPRIWYMGILEDNHIDCWASCGSLEQAINSL